MKVWTVERREVREAGGGVNSPEEGDEEIVLRRPEGEEEINVKERTGQKFEKGQKSWIMERVSDWAMIDIEEGEGKGTRGRRVRGEQLRQS